jgi:hypothetical protein
VDAPNPEMRWCCVPGFTVTALAAGVPGTFGGEAPDDEDAEPEDDDAEGEDEDAVPEDELAAAEPPEDDARLVADDPLDV